MPKNVVLIGGGAHAYAVLDMLKQRKGLYKVIGYCDRQETGLKCRYLGKDNDLLKIKGCSRTQVQLVMAIGVDVILRERVFRAFKKKGYLFLTYIHPAALVSPLAKVNEGGVIFPGVVLGGGVVLKENICVYSNSVIEHRTIIGGHAYVGPAVAIAGDCLIGKSSFWGIGSCCIEKISLPDWTSVGAGSVIIKSMKKENITLAGVPAKRIE